VRGGIAVIPYDGAISLLLNIGSRDVPFAKTLTWIEDVRASNQIGKDGAKLLKEKTPANGKVGLMDSGRGLPLRQLEELKEGLPDVQWHPCDALIEPLRLRKSARELGAMREAGRLLNVVCGRAGELIKPGRREYEMIADIDRLARDLGAEDIRILAGENRWNPPSFKRSATLGGHWAVYLAVQHERYWVEAGRTFILSGDAKLRAAYGKAQEVVMRMSEAMRPEGLVATIAEVARRELAERYAAATVYGLANGIGLNPWEAPFLSEDDAGQVGALSVGAAALDESMTLAVRVTFARAGKLVLFGDSVEVTASGARSLLGG
jgi:Xaa-Pro aminopeptidase